MQFMLIPQNGPEKFRSWDRDFRDVFAYISSIEPPKYPYPIDASLAERGRAAHLDGAHDAPLRGRHRRAMLLSIGFSVAAEHVRHFQPRTVHAASSEVLRCGGWGFNGYGVREQVEWA